MKRMTRILAVLGIAVTLAGCDKCGDALKFTPFEALKSCSTTNPQG